MRKIIPKHEEGKIHKKKMKILGFVLIFVMFGSVFGIVVNSFIGQNSANSKLKYGDYEFLNQNGLWYLSQNNFNFIFTYHPSQIENFETPIKNLALYQNRPLYVYSENKIAETEIYRNMQQAVQRIQPACLSEEKCDGDWPIKTCSDNFIIIEESLEKKGITQLDNCIYIRGSSEELLKLADEFLFRTIGVK